MEIWLNDKSLTYIEIGANFFFEKMEIVSNDSSGKYKLGKMNIRENRNLVK